MDLNHKILGAGEPIIILHGLFGMLDNWQTVAKVLANDFMVVLIDLRNHGKSFHSDQWSIEIMAEDVIRFMQDNWIHDAIVLGHSMGGKVAMEMALTENDMVNKLIVVDIAPKSYPRGHDLILGALSNVPIDSIQSREEAEDFLSSYIHEKGIRQFLLKNLTRDKEKGFKWKMNLEVIAKNYETIISETRKGFTFDNPTLFIRGENSDYITKEDEVLIKKLFLAAQMQTIRNAGHWVHADQPDQLIEAIKKFVFN